MQDWFYTQNGQQFGPVTAAGLRDLEAQGTITAHTLVWCAELTAWTPLGFVPATMLPGHSGALASPPLPEAMGGVERAHAFEFRGSAGEFFRIWIVNVVLTVLTLGIYAAWAKVRTKRYFHGNTLLEGKPFDFTGNPIAILKGNLIFGGLFAVNSIVGAVFPPLAILVALVIAGLAPWLIYKAMRFRARNTVHRNVRFDFRGTAGEAYGVFMGLPLLVPFTIGLLGPYVQFRQKKYFLGNLAWGNAVADCAGRAGFFYKTILKVVAVVVLLFGALLSSGMLAGNAAEMLKEKRAQRTQIEQLDQNATRDTASTTSAEEQERAKERVGAAIGSAMIVGMISVYILMVLLFTFYQVRTNNHMINATQWGSVGRIESRVRVRDLLWLYLTNGIVVLLTLGLMIPWVKVRMVRYRAARTVFISRGGLDSVAAALSAEESAIGDAGADVFDFDIGF